MGSKHIDKKCGDCQQWKPVADFYPSKRGGMLRDGYCKICRRIRDRLRASQRNKTVARLKAKDPDHFRRIKLLRNYGITIDEYNEMAAKQKGVCAICGWPEIRMVYGQPPRLVVDHNHGTGKVRGLLCCSCNARLAAVEDEQFILLAKAYLRDKDGYEFVGD